MRTSGFIPAGNRPKTCNAFRIENKQWRCTMNWDQIKGDWKQVTGKVKEQWGKLTDDEIMQIDGKRDQLVGRVQERYGVAKEAAEKQVKDWESRH
jgi:uncharacterized protein YjbJ (UPF0337 family)